MIKESKKGKGGPGGGGKERRETETQKRKKKGRTSPGKNSFSKLRLDGTMSRKRNTNRKLLSLADGWF